jgi:hypothetical protein
MTVDLPRRIEESRYAYQIRSVLTTEPTGTIWHYTSADGALGIINGQELWASSVPFLNDSTEIWHGLDLIERVAHEDESCEGFAAQIIMHARSKLKAFELQDSYVLSASMNGQSYPHFSEYGKYAIGLNPGMTLQKAVRGDSSISSPPMHPGFETGWGRVLYERDEKRDLAEKTVRALGEIAQGEGIDEGGVNQASEEGYLAALECVLRAAVHMKDELFRHEEEVRLYGRAARTDAQVKFRTRGEIIVPYIRIMADQDHPSLSGRLLPLMGVGLGPGVDAESAKIALDALLKSKGYHWITVNDVSGSHR